MAHFSFDMGRLKANRPILAIVLLAAVVRLGWPGLTEFKADEARLLTLALDMAEFKGLALRGIGSSVGFPNFPMSVWLFSIPLFFWKHPYAATLFVGLLNTAAVYLTYRLVRRYWNETAGLVAALMFALSPWAIIYSRKIWAQNLLPLFVLIYIGAALAAFSEKRRGTLAVHLFMLAVIVQIHLSGLALALLTLVLMTLHWRTTLAAWREVGLGAGMAAATMIPFMVWLAGQASGSGPDFAGNFLSRPAQISTDSIRYAWMILCGFDIHALAGPAAFRDFLNSTPNIDPVRWLWGLGALAGAVVALRRGRPADLLLVLWLVIPILFFVRHSTPVFPHYFIVTLPAGYMLAGVFVSWLREAGFKPAAVWAAMVASALAQGGAWLALLFFIGSHDTPNGFGTPLGATLNAVESVETALTEAGLPEVLVVGEGDDPAVHEFPAVMEALLRYTPHRFVNGNEAVVAPQGGAVVLLQSEALRASEWYAACAREQGCVWQGIERGLVAVTTPPGVIVRVENEFPQPRRLANGVEIIGWGAGPVWRLVWRPGYVPAASDYHFFNHAASAQADGAGYPSRYWRDGDVYVSFFDLQADGPVRVGMYEYPAVINVPVLDAAGLPYADALVAER